MVFFVCVDDHQNTINLVALSPPAGFQGPSPTTIQQDLGLLLTDHLAMKMNKYYFKGRVSLVTTIWIIWEQIIHSKIVSIHFKAFFRKVSP